MSAYLTALSESASREELLAALAKALDERDAANARAAAAIRDLTASIDPKSAATPLKWPVELTEPLRHALGFMNFQTGPFAHVYRAAGYDIPTRCEDEQAFVLHRFASFALAQGADWRKFAEEDLRAARAEAARHFAPPQQGDTMEISP